MNTVWGRNRALTWQLCGRHPVTSGSRPGSPCKAWECPQSSGRAGRLGAWPPPRSVVSCYHPGTPSALSRQGLWVHPLSCPVDGGSARPADVGGAEGTVPRRAGSCPAGIQSEWAQETGKEGSRAGLWGGGALLSGGHAADAQRTGMQPGVPSTGSAPEPRVQEEVPTGQSDPPC